MDAVLSLPADSTFPSHSSGFLPSTVTNQLILNQINVVLGSPVLFFKDALHFEIL